MKIGPLFKWFGSKWLSAGRYPIPQHDLIIEPFAGGAGFSLNYCERRVVLWEADPNLITLWRWLIEYATQADVLDIPIGLPVGTDIRTLGLSDGQAHLLKHWQRTNNVGDCWTTSPWGHLPGQWTSNTRSRVSEHVSAIKHWTLAPVEPLQDQVAHWFIDPVYEFNYRYRRSNPPIDYVKLAAFVQGINVESTVVVCEAARKSDGRIPSYLPFRSSHSSVTSRRKPEQSHHSNELVYWRPARDRMNAG